MEGSLVVTRNLQPLRSIDRWLCLRLILNLGRDTRQCLHVVALWKWLEAEFGYQNIILTLLRDTPGSVVNTIADEAVHCINCFLSETPPPDYSSLPVTTTEILGTQVRTIEISLPALHRYRRSALRQIRETVNDVILRASERRAALELVRQSAGLVPVQQRMIDPGSTSVVVERGESSQTSSILLNPNHIIGNEVPPTLRTLMITFSRDKPITEIELRDFFYRLFGSDCIEQVYMEVVNPQVRQSWYAHVLFRSARTVEAILHGKMIVDFVINGKRAAIRRPFGSTHLDS
ncbi:hypothetical protein BVC80_1835g580 [Macleaya cordata]|uniref:Uncharacterized protein n=1 Tax=Macleaya cordata TaxID=56857 RepID=A0A200R646_MACCD|nr:hypothetical protein BVC80_1835g580 [Macleaya cordata]